MITYNLLVNTKKKYLPQLSEGCHSEYVALAGKTVKINE
jgi:hypothetical protein